MVSSTSGAVPGRPDHAPTRVFGPARPVVVGSIVTAIVFGIVLEFLVATSFIGQRLWHHPSMFHEALFTLPLVLWVVVLALAVVLVLRTATTWMHVDGRGCTLHGLCRRTRRVPWARVGSVLAVRRVERSGREDPDELEDEDAFAGVYLLDRDGSDLLRLPSRLVGGRGQRTAMARAREAGVPVELVVRISRRGLRERVRRPLGFVERHPRLVALGVTVFYLGHNVLALAVWGL